MKRLRLVSKGTRLSPRSKYTNHGETVTAQNPAWDSLPEDRRADLAMRMAIYAAMIDRMDQNIARVTADLRARGELDNTLVMFLADNGGCAEELGPRSKGLHIPSTTLDGRPVKPGNTPGVMPGSEETYQSYGVPWANLSNTPFRLYKHWVHEGGIATPLIAAVRAAGARQRPLAFARRIHRALPRHARGAVRPERADQLQVHET